MRARTPQTESLTRRKRAAGRALALLLTVALSMPSLPAQSTSAPGAAPTRLKIQALTPAPMTEFAGTLSANVLQVRITDEWDMPVRGATVSFRLPEAGPGGVFLNGLSSEIALTDERGEAAVRGFDWRPDAGITFVHVIAAHGAARAGAMVEVHLARKVKEFPAAAASPAKPAPAEPVTAPAAAVADIPSQPAATSTPVETRAANSAVDARPALGQVAPAPAEHDRRAALLPPVNRAPRDLPSEPPDAGYLPPMVRVKGKPAGKSDDAASDPAARALVRVKQSGGGGGSKALILVLVAGAAAGGAVAVSMGRGGGGAASSGGGATLPPVIRIGNPTITITGGN